MSELVGIVCVVCASSISLGISHGNSLNVNLGLYFIHLLGKPRIGGLCVNTICCVVSKQKDAEFTCLSDLNCGVCIWLFVGVTW